MRVYIHKLGCPKNDVDADYIAARLVDAGHQPVSSPDDADSILVNTCGFILPAKEESINEILRLGELKKTGNLKSLYATGCLTQRYGDELLTEMPELDGAFGHGALDSIADAVTNSRHLTRAVRRDTRKLGYLTWKDRFISDGLPWSYLKISDGCDRACTYCAIPGMRGRFRSRPIDSIVREAQFLADNGKKELILVSQEATIYGYDLKSRPNIVDLLKELDNVDGIEWIRLMYLYPAQLERELIEYMADANKSLPYFDLPLQHINTEVLAGMRRRVTRPQIERQLADIRTIVPNPIIRTTFIVGFPGESEAQFEELRSFVETEQFERLGVFPYSAEEGTEAGEYEGQIAENEKLRRVDEIMSRQREIAFDHNSALIETTQHVMIDAILDDGRAVGRTYGDCPDIDQDVYVTGDDLAVGQIRPVKIDAVDGYDLLGTAVA